MQNESYPRLFLRFLRFGLLAFGGPFAQIAMIRQELVEREQWITRERFNRVMAVYQALPGPEAHELCVYFGTVARGRLGGLLAGLGFMLPGLVLVTLCAWLYTQFGLKSPLVLAAFAGCQAAVAALFVRAVERIGRHALSSRLLWAIAVLAFAAQWLGLPFWAVLLVAAAVGGLGLGARGWAMLGVGGLLLAGLWWMGHAVPASAVLPSTAQGGASVAQLFVAGLRGGLLTFGGAYTAIPFVQGDTVGAGWLTQAQFLDGLAITNVLPTPLVMFTAFVGYLSAGVPGALAMAAGMFVPAFAFTLIGHELMERLVDTPQLHAALDGVTAAVVGIVAATALQLAFATLSSPLRIAIFALALLAAFRLKGRWATAAIVLAVGVWGLLLGAL